MSVAGFTLGSVTSPGVITRASSGCGGTPLAWGRSRAELLARVSSPRWSWGSCRFAVVDLETTGWSPGAAAITEIGAVRVKGEGEAGRERAAG